MEMHQIRYFLAAAKSLSFTRAAKECHVSQPALTLAVKKLEERLGSALFHREGRRLALTEFGRQMQPHLSEIAARAELAQTLAQNFRLLAQVPIRLGVMATIGPMRLARFLAAFEHAVPGAELALREGLLKDVVGWLEADEIDFAILNPLEGLGDGFRADALYRERYLVLLPPDHPLRERNAISLADLSGEPYVDRLSCEMREMVMGVCAERGVKLYARFRSEREDWIQAMVMANLGFAFMPEHSVTHPDTVRRPLIDPTVERTIHLVSVPGRRHSPAVAAFARAARAHRWSAA